MRCGSVFGCVLRLVVYVSCCFFSSRRRHTRCLSDWSSDVCSSDLDGVASLIAGVEETAGGIDGEAARIVAARPFLTGERQASRIADGEPGDAVVQAVGGIDEARIRGNAHLRGEVRAGETLRQAGD